LLKECESLVKIVAYLLGTNGKLLRLVVAGKLKEETKTITRLVGKNHTE